MKSKIVPHSMPFVFIMLTIGLLLGSCKNDFYPNPQLVSSVYMPQAMHNPHIFNLSMSDTAQTITYGAYFGGVSNPAKDIKVQFEVNASFADSFNLRNQTNYPLLPPKSYTLEKTSAIIHKGKRATAPMTLSIKTIGFLTPSTEYLLPLSVISTNKSTKVSKSLGTSYFVIRANYDTTIVFMPQGGENPVMLNIPLKTNPQTITYSAKYSGANPEANLAIDFKADTNLTKAFNLSHGTNYPSMPEGSYELLQTTGTIPVGKMETQQLNIKLKLTPSMNSMNLRTGYLLPVRITGISGQDLPPNKKLILNKNQSIVYFLITDVDYIPLALNTTSDVSQMKVDDLGSGDFKFETTGGDPNIYTLPLSKNVGDHKILTFWFKGSPGSPVVNDFQIFFSPPVTESRSIHLGPSSATNSWIYVQIDLEQLMQIFSWGNEGDFLRLDFGTNAGVTIYIRNIRLEKK